MTRGERRRVLNYFFSSGIGIQGKYPDKWTTSFTLEYSEGEMFVPYRERGLIRVRFISQALKDSFSILEYGAFHILA